MDDIMSTPIVPPWIDIQFLSKALASSCGNINIVSSKVEGTTTQEKETSNYRVTMEMKREGRAEKKCLFVKTVRSVISEKSTSSDQPIDREIKAFNSLFVQMDKLLKSSYAPYCYYANSGPPAPVLVFEDLQDHGYETGTPSSGLDMSHCIIVMRKLAQFHAASVVLNYNHPEVLKPFKNSAYSDESRAKLENIFPPILRKLAKEVASWPDYKDRFGDVLYRLADTSVEEICECVKTNENDFNVLCHEDLWLKNILFRYSEATGEPENVRFVNFQSVHWGSPAIDIHRFLHACAAPEVLEWSQVLFEEYYSVLKETLHRLGHPELCPTVAHFHDQQNKRIMLGLILGLVGRAFQLGDIDFSPSLDKIITSPVNIEFSEHYKLVVRKLLFVLQVKGWIGHKPWVKT